MKKDKERLEELLSLRDREVKELKTQVDSFTVTLNKEKKVIEEKLFQ